MLMAFESHGNTCTETLITDCDTCRVPMVINDNEYMCEICGSTRAGVDQIEDTGPTGASAITLMSGDGRIQTFNASGPAEKSRADALIATLLCNQREYGARNGGKSAFPMGILTAVAARYADIQQQHEIRQHGQFIHRGEVRKEFIAWLLLDECGVQRYPLKSEIIADFMKLNSTGFSNGGTIMQKLVTMGLTTICEPCPPVRFAERYLDLLGLLTKEHVNFVIGIVDTSEQIHLCMNSHVPSKVVGAIRLLVVALDRRDITPEIIEAETENTKVNTYMKFYNAIVDHLSKFIWVFEEYGIGYPIFDTPRKAGRRCIKSATHAVKIIKLT